MPLIEELQKREFNIIEIFAIGKGVYKSCFKAIFDVAIFIGLPINILIAFVSMSVADYGSILNIDAIMKDQALLEQFIQSEAWRNIGIYYILLVVIQSMVFPLVTMAVAKIVNEFINGKVIPSKVAMKESFACGAVLIFASLIHEFIVGVGTIMFIIPGAIFYIIMYFYVYAIIIDGKGVFGSINYSMKLTRKRFLKTAVAVIIIFTTNYSVAYLINILFSLLNGGLITTAFAGTVRTVVDCFFIVAITLYYTNRKALVEGNTQKSYGIF